MPPMPFLMLICQFYRAYAFDCYFMRFLHCFHFINLMPSSISLLRRTFRHMHFLRHFPLFVAFDLLYHWYFDTCIYLFSHLIDAAEIIGHFFTFLCYAFIDATMTLFFAPESRFRRHADALPPFHIRGILSGFHAFSAFAFISAITFQLACRFSPFHYRFITIVYYHFIFDYDIIMIYYCFYASLLISFISSPPFVLFWLFSSVSLMASYGLRRLIAHCLAFESRQFAIAAIFIR